MKKECEYWIFYENIKIICEYCYYYMVWWEYDSSSVIRSFSTGFFHFPFGFLETQSGSGSGSASISVLLWVSVSDNSLSQSWIECEPGINYFLFSFSFFLFLDFIFYFLWVLFVGKFNTIAHVFRFRHLRRLVFFHIIPPFIL